MTFRLIDAETIAEVIKKHINCTKEPTLESGEKATCLDMVILELGLQGYFSPIKDKAL